MSRLCVFLLALFLHFYTVLLVPQCVSEKGRYTIVTGSDDGEKMQKCTQLAT